MNAKDRIIVALDGDWNQDTLLEKSAQFAGFVGMVKIGKRPFTRLGPSCVKRLQEQGQRVFLDLKYHDIPNTVANACKEAVRLGVAMLNVHASGGSAMMRRAREAVDEASRKLGVSPPLLIAVTVLTSLDEAQLAETGVLGSLGDQVRRLALLAKSCGMDGVVASPKEVTLIRDACGPDFVIVTPGIRPAGIQAGDDQKRVTTPADAIKLGSDYLVIGRPIVGADDPAKAAQDIAESLEFPS